MLIRELATVRDVAQFHTVVENWCIAHSFSYDAGQSLRRNIRSARQQSKFTVCQALSEAEKVYESISELR